MIGTAGVKGLRVDCVVGVYPHERAAAQTVLLDVDVDYDFARAAASDALADAVDYDRIVSGVTDLLRERRFQLLETMAEDVAAWLFAQVAAATAVRLEIRKPAAVPAAECSFVRVTRVRA